jgi:hypothetical protein
VFFRDQKVLEASTAMGFEPGPRLLATIVPTGALRRAVRSLSAHTPKFGPAIGRNGGKAGDQVDVVAVEAGGSLMPREDQGAPAVTEETTSGP